MFGEKKYSLFLGGGPICFELSLHGQRTVWLKVNGEVGPFGARLV